MVVTADKIVLAGDPNGGGTSFFSYQKSDMLAGIYNVQHSSNFSSTGEYQAAVKNTNAFDAKFVAWSGTNGSHISAANISGTPSSNNVTLNEFDLGTFASGQASITDPIIPGGQLGGHDLDGRIMTAMEETETSDNKPVIVFSAVYNCPGSGQLCTLVGKLDISAWTPVFYGGNSGGNTYYESYVDITYGAVGMDAAGNQLIVESRSNSGSTPNAALWSPGHFYNVIYGNTSGTTCGSGPNCDERWGDYLGIAQDPSNTNYVWVVGEYQASSGGGGWGTVIAEASATQLF